MVCEVRMTRLAQSQLAEYAGYIRNQSKRVGGSIGLNSYRETMLEKDLSE